MKRRLCLGLLGLSLGLAVAGAQASDETATKDSSLPLQELRVFAEVFARVQKDYVEPISDKELIDYAIKGMLEGLDPHSSYLDSTHFKQLQEGTSGKFGGLGIEVGMKDGLIHVIAPIDDTPAKRAGIQAGDLIIRIDEKPVKGMSLSEAVKLMRGKPGTKVKLTVRRKGEKAPLIIEIQRDIIKTSSVRAELLEPGYGYVRISQFQAPTADDLLKAVARLKKESKGALHGLVLDLRNNPGGVLQGAVAVSDAFLEKGMIVYTRGRGGDSLLEFKAKPGDVLDGAPLVVLVNEGSASASEIVAGALQDHKRAVIMGRTTFGKGSVQTIIPISSKIAIKLTTARYYTPNGRSIQAQGIVPDIVLKEVELKEKHANLMRVKEADLADHLANPDDRNGKPKTKPNARKSTAELLDKDYELQEALNLLKGIAILRAKQQSA